MMVCNVLTTSCLCAVCASAAAPAALWAMYWRTKASSPLMRKVAGWRCSRLARISALAMDNLHANIKPNQQTVTNIANTQSVRHVHWIGLNFLFKCLLRLD
jgi:hypothetical protein